MYTLFQIIIYNSSSCNVVVLYVMITIPKICVLHHTSQKCNYNLLKLTKHRGDNISESYRWCKLFSLFTMSINYGLSSSSIKSILLIPGNGLDLAHNEKGRKKCEMDLPIARTCRCFLLKNRFAASLTPNYPN